MVDIVHRVEIQAPIKKVHERLASAVGVDPWSVRGTSDGAELGSWA